MHACYLLLKYVRTTPADGNRKTSKAYLQGTGHCYPLPGGVIGVSQYIQRRFPPRVYVNKSANGQEFRGENGRLDFANASERVTRTSGVTNYQVTITGDRS